MEKNNKATFSGTKIGQRIRSLRRKQKLSVRELAEKSGLSAIAISKIERDQVSPTLNSLECLAYAMGLKMIDLFLEDLDSEVIVNQTSILPAARNSEIHITSLASGLRDQFLEPYLVSMQPGEEIQCAALPDSSEVFAWCLKGSSIFTINGIEYKILPSENILFRSYTPFSIQNSGKTANEILFIFEAPMGNHFANQHLN